MKAMLNLLLWIFTFIGPGWVHAGHPLWESSLKGVKHAVPIDVNSDTVTTWPGNRVRYTYKDFDTEYDFNQYIRTSTNMWLMAGLPGIFSFILIPREECFRNRRDCVVFETGAGEDEWTTVVGKYIGMTTDAFPGSYATFNRNPNDRGTEIEIKAVHQIGHVLGLYHEHQNPNFWDPQEGGFGPGHYFKVNCENLKGYEEAIEGLTPDEIQGRGGICRYRPAAIQRGFHVAAHILPMLELTYLPWYTDHPTPDDVDWDSVMIYSSATGAKVRHRWGLVRDNDFERTGVPDSRVYDRIAPSQRDIAGLIQLYAAVDTRFEHRYFHDPHSMYFPAFNEMRNFAACDRDIQQPRSPPPP